MLVYIEDKNHLAQILSYLDLANIPYTTNLKENYHTVLITDINSRILNSIKNKKVILFTEFIADKILHQKFLIPKIENLTIITSIEQLKSKENTYYIPSIIPTYTIKKEKDIYNKYHLIKNKKRILIIDTYLNHIDEVEKISELYPKYEILYIGYRNLKKGEKAKLNNMNVTWIKYVSIDNYNHLCNVSQLSIIYTPTIPIKYIYMTILTHTELFLIDTNIYQEYLTPSKHYFSFHDIKSLQSKLNKYLTERTSSLNDNAYFLIRENTEKNFIEKLKKYLL